MRTSNSKAVYKKLTNIYGNSLESVLAQNSPRAFYEDEYTKDPYAEETFEEQRKNVLKRRLINQMKNEPVILAGTLFSLINKSEELEEDEKMVFFTEDFLECDDYQITSRRVQRKIENLAAKVTRSIINSKRLDNLS